MWHSATLLSDGRVLIAGGFDGRKATAAVEVSDARTGAFAAGGPLATARHGHSATLLPDGRVLLVGGATRLHGDGATATAEVWDPATGTSTPSGSMAQSRWRHGAALLPDGRVLVIGGTAGAGDDYEERQRAEIRDPRTGRSSDAGTIMVEATGLTATPLADGRVLVVDRARPSSPKTRIDPRTCQRIASSGKPACGTRSCCSTLPQGHPRTPAERELRSGVAHGHAPSRRARPHRGRERSRRVPGHGVPHPPGSPLSVDVRLRGSGGRWLVVGLWPRRVSFVHRLLPRQQGAFGVATWDARGWIAGLMGIDPEDLAVRSIDRYGPGETQVRYERANEAVARLTVTGPVVPMGAAEGGGHWVIKGQIGSGTRDVHGIELPEADEIVYE